MRERLADREVIHAHALVQVLGREQGLRKASADGLNERLVRTLEDFYAHSSGELGIQFSGWSFLSLPHKALPPTRRWNEPYTLRDLPVRLLLSQAS